jgi:cell division protein FtsZ
MLAEANLPTRRYDYDDVPIQRSTTPRASVAASETSFAPPAASAPEASAPVQSAPAPYTPATPPAPAFQTPAPVIPLPPIPAQAATPNPLRIETLPASAPVSAFPLEPAAPQQPAAPVVPPAALAQTSIQTDTPAGYQTGTPSEPSPQRSVSGPELVPVAASIFDDDFFRASATRSVPPEPQPERETPSRYDAISSGRAAFGETRILELEHAPIEAPARVPSFAGLATSPTDNGDADELDIPAFLRRGH